ncbi:MerR family transcriptional regulator [Pseudoroseicyclus sp. CXY001]|uniref:MerR family transcriptional regulator n=1 Tax=Pseudoroseicyclus sp. CXY001 TaxID=3242492 RepID=UPI003570EC00
MRTTQQDFTVSELAGLAGVSVRTLHHYHEIGLLLPAHQGANGYRLYGRAERLRLQEILFYRAFGLGLAEIGAMLEEPGGAAARLRSQRGKLAAEAARLTGLLAELDRTILSIETGDFDMTDALYVPHSAERQAGYEAWLIETYGAPMARDIEAARAAVATDPAGMEGLMEELRTAEAALVAAFEAGETGTTATAAFDRHRDLVARFWGKACPPEAYAGLAQIYESHPDFIARYERLAPRFSAWLPAEMRRYATRP